MRSCVLSRICCIFSASFSSHLLLLILWKEDVCEFCYMEFSFYNISQCIISYELYLSVHFLLLLCQSILFLLPLVLFSAFSFCSAKDTPPRFYIGELIFVSIVQKHRKSQPLLLLIYYQKLLDLSPISSFC